LRHPNEDLHYPLLSQEGFEIPGQPFRRHYFQGSGEYAAGIGDGYPSTCFTEIQSNDPAGAGA
ncbi:MAG: hypothetical protein M3266_05605, partial [Actinomycetota bacterium]|nr:hypothetical protein [Actinomycetota bacterium]